MGNEMILAGTAYLSRPGAGRFAAVSPAEVADLVAAAPTTQTRLLLRMLWATGARISEVLTVRAGDVDRRKNEVTIRRLKRRKKFEQVLPIPQDIAGELSLWIRAEKLKPRSLLFRSDRKSAWKSIRSLGVKVLSRKISPKAFRHGKAYQMAGRGVHPLIISRALGHASLSSALAYYHPTDTDLREAMQ